MISIEEFLQQVRLDYYRDLSENQQAEIERLNRELKLAQAGWKSGDADEFLEASQNANNALEIKE